MLEPCPPDGEGLPAAAPAARPRARTAWRPQPIPGPDPKQLATLTAHVLV